ncbi:MAG: polyprenyl synthetase family protein [Thermoguttaceae bacterium]
MSLELVDRLIHDEMDVLEQNAIQTLSHIDPFIEKVVRYSFANGGKRLRPSLLFLVAKSLGSVSMRQIRMATAIEFVHTASLIHDDILDGGSLRRHLATHNVLWSVQVGVLAGDYLLTQAMQLVTEEEDLYGFRQLTEACRVTCEGELRQIGLIGQFDMTSKQYFEIIAGKTAPLLACSAQLGAFYADSKKQIDSETVHKFRSFGHKIGIAFQMIDDILDLIGNMSEAGKTLRTDILNRKPTLPLILYFEQISANKRDDMILLLNQDNLSNETAEQIVTDLLTKNVTEQVYEIAAKIVNEAIDDIRGISKNADAFDAICSLAHFVINRKK